MNAVQDLEMKNRVKVVEEEKRINQIENEKNNRYKKANAALLAKLKFIEENYDYSSKAKAINIADFKEIMDSNLNVNSSIEGFTQKLSV